MFNFEPLQTISSVSLPILPSVGSGLESMATKTKFSRSEGFGGEPIQTNPSNLTMVLLHQWE